MGEWFLRFNISQQWEMKNVLKSIHLLSLLVKVFVFPSTLSLAVPVMFFSPSREGTQQNWQWEIFWMTASILTSPSISLWVCIEIFLLELELIKKFSVAELHVSLHSCCILYNFNLVGKRATAFLRWFHVWKACLLLAFIGFLARACYLFHSFEIPQVLCILLIWWLRGIFTSVHISSSLQSLPCWMLSMCSCCVSWFP